MLWPHFWIIGLDFHYHPLPPLFGIEWLWIDKETKIDGWLDKQLHQQWHETYKIIYNLCSINHLQKVQDNAHLSSKSEWCDLCLHDRNAKILLALILQQWIISRYKYVQSHIDIKMLWLMQQTANTDFLSTISATNGYEVWCTIQRCENKVARNPFKACQTKWWKNRHERGTEEEKEAKEGKWWTCLDCSAIRAWYNRGKMVNAFVQGINYLYAALNIQDAF